MLWRIGLRESVNIPGIRGPIRISISNCFSCFLVVDTEDICIYIHTSPSILLQNSVWFRIRWRFFLCLFRAVSGFCEYFSSFHLYHMGSITEATILHHVCIMLFVLWILSFFNYAHSFAYILCFVYLFLVHEGYVLKLRKKLQFEEKRASNQRRILSESETLRWLNYAVEKMWPICMEEIVSQRMLLPIAPWFLQKYKPWTVGDVTIQNLYLGRSPPTFTDMRIVQQANGDDHLVMELGMNFLTADDMSSVLAVKLRKRLGFGMLTKLHLLGLHVEGKVLVGVKFLRQWPFISRLRLCFVGPPYFRMTVKPIFTRGLDVTEVPGIAGWIDNLLALVFEQTLVEPNMLVVDVEKFVSPQQENWFSVNAKDPIALATVEVLEAAEIKPSDMNGLADPYVKGRMGPYRFQTKIERKTLTPKWFEEFKIPICSWESQNMLTLEVRDKDLLNDDTLGDCCVNINELRDGQRHDNWWPLKNIKMGRMHLAITVSEVNVKDSGPLNDAEGPEEDEKASFVDASLQTDSSENIHRVADKFEPIDVMGQAETGVWIHHPSSETAHEIREPRKGKGRGIHVPNLDGSLKARTPGQNEGSSADETMDSDKRVSDNPVMEGFKRIGSAFRRRNSRDDKNRSFPESPRGSYVNTPRDNIRSSSSKGESGVRLMIDESIAAPSPNEPRYDENEPDGPHHQRKRDAAKDILKQSAHGLKVALSRRSSSRYNAETGSWEKGRHSNEVSSDDESLLSVRDKDRLVTPGSTVSPQPSPVLTPGTVSFSSAR